MTRLSSSNSRQFYIFCDGGARGNPGPAAVGVVVKDNRGRTWVEISKYIGRTTNNVAEYKAVIAALEWIVKNQASFRLPVSRFQFYLDSKLVVNQLRGLFRIKNSNLQALIIKLKGLENQVKHPIFYRYIPRDKNKQADRLVNQALDKLAR